MEELTGEICLYAEKWEEMEMKCSVRLCQGWICAEIKGWVSGGTEDVASRKR